MKKNKIIKTLLLLVAIVFIGCIIGADLVSANSLWDAQKQTTGIDKVGKKAFGNETPQDVRLIIVRAIRVFLGFLGIVFVVLMVMAGFKYMTSQGNEDKIEEAVAQIKNAIIGLVIIMISWSITSFVSTCVLDLTGNSTVWMCNLAD
jgi:hypothetical protein